MKKKSEYTDPKRIPNENEFSYKTRVEEPKWAARLLETACRGTSEQVDQVIDEIVRERRDAICPICPRKGKCKQDDYSVVFPILQEINDTLMWFQEKVNEKFGPPNHKDKTGMFG